MSSGDHIYFDANFQNPTDANGQGKSKQAVFSQTFTSALLLHPVEYYCTITKFDVDSSLIPSLIFQDGLWQISIQDSSGNQHPAVLMWQPTSTDVLSRDIFSWYHFLDILNTAFAAAWADATLAEPGYVGIPAPYIVLEPSSELLILYAPISLTPYNIYISNTLAPFFTNFSLFHRPDNSNGLYEYNIIFPLFPGYPDPLTPMGFQKITQDFPSLSQFGSVRSIRFVSPNLPSRPEQLTGLNNQQNILTDLSIDLSSTGGGARGFIQYTPTAEYRLIDLTSNAPLNRIDLIIFWVDNKGDPHPVLIPPNGTCLLKMLFRARHLGVKAASMM